MRFVVALLVLSSGCGPWGTAKRVNSVESYANYLAANPSSRHAEDAHRRAERARWKRAETDGRASSYQAYLYAHPDGKHAEEAAVKLDNATFREARGRGQFESYLRTHSKGRHTKEAAKAIEELDWAEANKARTPASYAAYINHNPEGAHIAEASKLRDDMIWSGVAEEDLIPGYRRYLSDHPTTRYSPDAKARIEELTFLRARIVIRVQKTWREEPLSLADNVSEQLKLDFVHGLIALGFHKDIPIETIDGTRSPEQIHPLDAFPVESGTGLFLIDLEETRGEDLKSGYATIIDATVQVYAAGRREAMASQSTIAETEAYVVGSSQDRLNLDAEKRLGRALMGSVRPQDYLR